MISIVFEDEYVIGIVKPNNVVVHHAKYSRNVSNEFSLLDLLFQQNGLRYYPIHRLDRKTSGVMLLAKETSYVKYFQELFTENNIQKAYLGIVRGFSPDDIIIDSPVKGRDSNVYKNAETHLKTLNKITLDFPVKPYNTSRYSLVELLPKTGRLHQLRIHLNKISHPLIGDSKYGDKNHNLMFQDKFQTDKLFLHAYKLNFIHPYTNENVKLVADLPKDWHKILNIFNWNVSL